MQGFPDNYTPTESFLAAIEKNKDLRLYSLQECLQGAAEVGKEVGRGGGFRIEVVNNFRYHQRAQVRLYPTISVNG